jgi:hypothetical protein
MIKASSGIGGTMSLNTIRIRAALGFLLIGLSLPLGCGEQPATKSAPEPNVGPAGPSTGPAPTEKTPAKPSP